MKKNFLLSALLIFACSSDSEGNDCIYEPTLSTEAVTDITETSATLNGVISIVSENCDIALGGMQGFVYSTNPSPTNDDNVEVVYGTDISTTIDNLIPNTTYYVRVFITNSLGEFYGNEMEFTTEDDNGEPADCDVVYLDSNGITIKACESANIGDVGTINGVEYTVVDSDILRQMVQNGEDVTRVCTTRITSMSNMMTRYLDEDGLTYISINQPIGNWDVSNVNTMFRMFADNDAFNQDLSNWDVSNVGVMTNMFLNASAFNQPIGNWDMGNLSSISGMFRGASSFNQPIGDWDVSNVMWMRNVFMYCPSFNQDISNWDVSMVNFMDRMFYHTTEFNQDLSGWNVNGVAENPNGVFDCEGFSDNTPQWTLPQPNFTNCNPN